MSRGLVHISVIAKEWVEEMRVRSKLTPEQCKQRQAEQKELRRQEISKAVGLDHQFEDDY